MFSCDDAFLKISGYQSDAAHETEGIIYTNPYLFGRAELLGCVGTGTSVNTKIEGLVRVIVHAIVYCHATMSYLFSISRRLVYQIMVDH